MKGKKVNNANFFIFFQLLLTVNLNQNLNEDFAALQLVSALADLIATRRYHPTPKHDNSLFIKINFFLLYGFASQTYIFFSTLMNLLAARLQGMSQLSLTLSLRSWSFLMSEASLETPRPQSR
jgi:hypothetical protein